jgi:hypothetical protein
VRIEPAEIEAILKQAETEKAMMASHEKKRRATVGRDRRAATGVLSLATVGSFVTTEMRRQ